MTWKRIFGWWPYLLLAITAIGVAYLVWMSTTL
jgi:hypothetical protein